MSRCQFCGADAARNYDEGNFCSLCYRDVCSHQERQERERCERIEEDRRAQDNEELEINITEVRE